MSFNIDWTDWITDCNFRRQWADYFESQGIQYAFFSAANAVALQEARRDALAAEEEARRQAELAAADRRQAEEDGSEAEEDEEATAEAALSNDTTSPPADESDEEYETDSEDEDPYGEAFPLPLEEDSEDARDPRARVLSVLELEDLFTQAAPDLSGMFTQTSDCVL